MLTKITVLKKIVRHKNQNYRLTYRLLLQDDFHYGIEVTCQYGNITETENILVGDNRRDALRLLYLFAKETVFPVALRETFENL